MPDTKDHIFHIFIWNVQNRYIQGKTENKLMIFQGQGVQSFFGGHEYVLELVVIVAWFCEYTKKNHWIVCFKRVILWYLNYISTKNSTHYLSFIDHPCYTPQSDVFSSSFEIVSFGQNSFIETPVAMPYNNLCDFPRFKGGIYWKGYHLKRLVGYPHRYWTGSILVENLLWSNQWFQPNYPEMLSCQCSRVNQTCTIPKLTRVGTWALNSIIFIVIKISCLVDWSY